MILDAQIIATALFSAGIQIAMWAWVQRRIQRRDAEVDTLTGEVKSLRDEKVAGLIAGQTDDTRKRKAIYERMEKIELGYMTKAECEKMHAGVNEQARNFVAAVMKFERLQGNQERLLQWMDDVSKEQISLGKDMAALTATVEGMKKT